MRNPLRWMRVALFGRREGWRRWVLAAARSWFRREDSRSSESVSGGPEVAPARSDAPGGSGEPEDAGSGPWTEVLDSAQLREGEVTEVLFEGRPVALARVDGRVFALEGTCPHAGGPLGEGSLDGREVVCPWHGWRFDCASGACDMDPSGATGVLRSRERTGRIALTPSA